MLRVRKYINAVLVDQLPVLADVQVSDPDEMALVSYLERAGR